MLKIQHFKKFNAELLIPAEVVRQVTLCRIDHSSQTHVDDQFYNELLTLSMKQETLKFDNITSLRIKSISSFIAGSPTNRGTSPFYVSLLSNAFYSKNLKSCKKENYTPRLTCLRERAPLCVYCANCHSEQDTIIHDTDFQLHT